MDKNTIEAEVMDHQFYWGGNAPDLGWSAHDQDYCRPDHAVMDMEEEVDYDDLPTGAAERFRSQGVMRFLDLVTEDFARDNDPAAVGRKVLSYAKWLGHQSVDSWSLAELAIAGMETKAAVSARIRKTCNEPIEAMDGIAQARFQQGPDQRAVSAAAQMGNKNRAGKTNK